MSFEVYVDHSPRHRERVNLRVHGDHPVELAAYILQCPPAAIHLEVFA